MFKLYAEPSVNRATVMHTPEWSHHIPRDEGVNVLRMFPKFCIVHITWTCSVFGSERLGHFSYIMIQKTRSEPVL